MEEFRKLAEAGGEGPGRMFVPAPSVVDVEIAEAQKVAEVQYERLRTEAPDLVTMVVKGQMTLAAAAAELTKRNAALPGNVPIEAATPIPKPPPKAKTQRWQFPRGALRFAREAVEKHRTKIDKAIMTETKAIRQEVEATECPEIQWKERARYAANEFFGAKKTGKKGGGSTPVSTKVLKPGLLKPR
jgi:hypothetical protein